MYKKNKKMDALNNNIPTQKEALATLGTGCFWCTEAVFQLLEGVNSVVSAYAGGHVANPTYEQVCSKQSGHAEVVRISYNPDIISYEELLDVFWQSHDPTTLNQQGNDKGPQYRSAIFYHNEEQKKIAEASLARTDASDLWPDPIVTEITELNNYYPAEDYHQNYYNRMGDKNPYCVYVVGPKVQKMKKKLAQKKV